MKRRKSILKPCPFCGADETSEGQPEIIRRRLPDPHEYVYDYAVRCQRCGVQTDWYPDEDDDAVEAWNTRVKEEEKP